MRWIYDLDLDLGVAGVLVLPIRCWQRWEM